MIFKKTVSFVDAVQKLVEYIYDCESEDFFEQIQTQGQQSQAVKSHVYLVAMAADKMLETITTGDNSMVLEDEQDLELEVEE